ncbi:MAG: helix-hairpin-helix domain-containing protein [Acidobacteriia bacterium]|nr:helix-hairpin-helix domain-containing protein [Terriglobia bacterium]
MTGAVCAQAPAKAVDKAAKAAGKAADKTATKAADKAADKAGALIDINRATPAELKSIPGIGDAYSAAIVKGRPYANKTQLKSKGVVPDGVYEKIKDKIIAKQ